MISLIVARARNGAIGKDGSIPWDIPEDLRFFQHETKGGAVIMGRKTWDSLPVRPLPHRFNLVISRNADAAPFVAASVEEGVRHLRNVGYQRIYGMGGAGIYSEMLPFADRLLISEVDLEIPDADTFFPEISREDWVAIDVRYLRKDEPSCRLFEYVRRRPAPHPDANSNTP